MQYNKLELRAYVYCHIKDLQSFPRLKEKAILFAQERKIQIAGFCASNIYTMIHRLAREDANIVLINNHSLTNQEYRILIAYCHRHAITIIYFEKNI